MMQPYLNENTACRSVQLTLSEYLDNALSARQMLGVEKHLTHCAECAEQARQLQLTVHLIRSVERLDTSDHFMAKLHARLDGLEPDRARPSLSSARYWFHAMRNMLRTRRAPVFGLGMAMVGLAALLFVRRPAEPISAIPTEPLQRNAALAGNLFDDPVAAILEAHAAQKATSAQTAANTAQETD